MPVPELLKEIESLFNELQSLRPLKREDEERLWKKFRLEWNFNSNHMEGNTLTYGETELLLMFGKVSGDHEVRELEEMQAHDAIVKLVREYAADKTRDLTESDIRQWNRTILVKPFWKEAITPDGQATRKLIEPGNYKSSPNSVRLSNGEIFHYASPEETPIKMRDLLDWYRNVTEANKLHPVEIAALLHYKFVRIHPFDDSNGRTARLLMNYVLLKNDYPPVIIKSADKKNYLFALNKADTGDENAFVEYISNQLVWSLEINIKAARGESIEAPDDIDKEISVWKKNLSVKLPPLTKSNNVVIDLFRSTIQTFIQEFLTRAGQLDEIFLEKRIWILYRIGDQGSHDVTSDKNYGLMHLEAKLTQLLQSNGTMPHRVDYIGVAFSYRGYRPNPRLDMDLRGELKFLLHDFYFEIIFNDIKLNRFAYTETLVAEDIGGMVSNCLKVLFEELKKQQV